MKIQKIVSGGQTGADRAAFDFAIAKGIEIGGYVPKGRLAEDGPIPDRYPNLIETESADPGERTRLNIIDSDGTLILSHGDLTGGALLTQQTAKEISKPYIHIDLLLFEETQAARMASEWVVKNNIAVLNIAGPRASEDPLIYSKTVTVLDKLFSK